MENGEKTTNVSFGFTERDLQILELMARFGGKTFIYVLAKTLWKDTKSPEQQARNRIQKLKKRKIVRYKETKLVNPKNAIVLTDAGKRAVEEIFGIAINSIEVSHVTTWHTIYEQLTFFALNFRLKRDVERTIVSKWRKKGYRHTPDLAYKNDKSGLVYVEIELTHKRPDYLIEIFTKVKQDGVSAVLYVFENEKRMKTLGTKIPIWDKIRYITIDELLKNSENGKIGAIKQSDFLKSQNLI